jgi:hypothetical protein
LPISWVFIPSGLLLYALAFRLSKSIICSYWAWAPLSTNHPKSDHPCDCPPAVFPPMRLGLHQCLQPMGSCPLPPQAYPKLHLPTWLYYLGLSPASLLRLIPCTCSTLAPLEGDYITSACKSVTIPITHCHLSAAIWVIHTVGLSPQTSPSACHWEEKS